MKIIPLTQNKTAMISDADFERFSQRKYYAKKTGRNGSYYAARHQRINGKSHTFYLHREITNCPVGMEVDHFPDKNTLNCQRENLCVVTKAENLKNRRGHGLANKFLQKNQ